MQLTMMFLGASLEAWILERWMQAALDGPSMTVSTHTDNQSKRLTAVRSSTRSCQPALLSGRRIASGQAGHRGDVDDVRGILVIGALEKEVFQAREVSAARSILDSLPNNGCIKLVLARFEKERSRTVEH